MRGLEGELEAKFKSKEVYLNKTIAKADAAPMIGMANVTIKGLRIELCHDEYLVDATVDTVAHRNIDELVATTNRNLHNTKSGECILIVMKN